MRMRCFRVKKINYDRIPRTEYKVLQLVLSTTTAFASCEKVYDHIYPLCIDRAAVS